MKNLEKYAPEELLFEAMNNANQQKMTKHEYYLGIAEAVMQRSNCLRRKYGAVIIKDDEIIATGYNGVPRGEKHCETCSKGNSKDYINQCRSVHAEMNAIISAARRDMLGSTLYLASDKPNAKPCDICRRLIINAGIAKVITKEKIKK